MTKTTTDKRKEISLFEWETEGERLFGSDRMLWRFVCPMCGVVKQVRAWFDAGAPETTVAFSCVGRWDKAVDCTYAGGGLFKLNPVTLLVDGERVSTVFAFDENEQASDGA